MAHPKNPSEAVALLGVGEKTSVLAVGPDNGYVEALVDVVGKGGKVIVQAPPPELDAPKSVEIVEELNAETKADTVIGWVGVVPVHGARDLGAHVSDGGALWLVLPKVDRDSRAPVTEGDVKRAMLSAGWKEDRVETISNDAFAVRFRRRR